MLKALMVKNRWETRSNRISHGACALAVLVAIASIAMGVFYLRG